MMTAADTKITRIGVLGTGGIVRLAVPQMQQSKLVSVAAIASRDLDKARAVAADLGIPRTFGSYEALLADTDLDAVYVALPVALHAEWAIRAVEAGKDVLCEKPLTSGSNATLHVAKAAQRTGRMVWEGFMLRHHPQWRWITETIRSGRIGSVRAVQGMLTRTPPNAHDPHAIANRPELGGGVLLDGGCYMVHLARLAFGSEPRRVSALGEVDGDLGVTTFFSAMMRFDTGTACFTVSSRLHRFQRFLIVGTDGSIDVRVPVMPHPVQPTVVVADYADAAGGEPEAIEFGPVPSFCAQVDAFAVARAGGAPAPFGLDDSLANAVALEALERSAQRDGIWTDVPLEAMLSGQDGVWELGVS